MLCPLKVCATLLVPGNGCPILVTGRTLMGPGILQGPGAPQAEGADVFQGTKQLVIKSFCSSFSGDSSDLYPLLTVNALSSPLPLGPSLEPWASAVAHQPHNFSIPMASASPHLCLLKAGYYPLSLHFFFFHFGPPQQ